jgi:nucleotide-binding universal stress UspA family protein
MEFLHQAARNRRPQQVDTARPRLQLAGMALPHQAARNRRPRQGDTAPLQQAGTASSGPIRAIGTEKRSTMKKVLIAVDDTKGSKNAFTFCLETCACMRPESILLLYVERFEGRSLMTEMLPDSELSTLRGVLEGSEYKKMLDKRAEQILGYYRKLLEDKGLPGIKTIKKMGSPAEEILKTAKKEGVDLIIIGSRGTRVGHLFMGSVSREVANNTSVPVLVAK